MRTAPADRAAIPDGLRIDNHDTPFPMHRVRRVDAPTTTITSDVTRFDEREHGFLRALRGDYGPVPRREFLRFVDKYPLSGAMKAVEHHLVRGCRRPGGCHAGPATRRPGHSQQAYQGGRPSSCGRTTSASVNCRHTPFTPSTRTARPWSWDTPTPSPCWSIRAHRPSTRAVVATGSATPRASAPTPPRP